MKSVILLHDLTGPKKPYIPMIVVLMTGIEKPYIPTIVVLVISNKKPYIPMN